VKLLFWSRVFTDKLNEERTMRSSTKKAELIEKYQAREPRLFVRVDALKTTGDGDNLMPPDGDGFWFQARPSRELIDGADITLLIDPRTDRKDAISMLKKIAIKIEEDWSRLLEETMDEVSTAGGIEGIAESLIRIRGFGLADFERLAQAAKDKLGEKKREPDEEWPF
jgi:hypothetical protein